MISDQRTRAYVAKRTATADVPHGVDVCTAVLGQTWTPALERTGVTYDPETDVLAEDVADEIIANIANGPTHVVRARNQAIAARVWPDRRTLVQMIGAHTSAHAARTSATHSSATAPPASRLGLATSGRAVLSAGWPTGGLGCPSWDTRGHGTRPSRRTDPGAPGP
jgi:hypothetical protein